MKEQLEIGHIYKVISRIECAYGKNINLKIGDKFLVISKFSNIKKTLMDIANEMQGEINLKAVLENSEENYNFPEVVADEKEDCIYYTILNMSTDKKEGFSTLYVYSDISTINNPVFGIYNSPEESELTDMDNFHKLRTCDVFKRMT